MEDPGSGRLIKVLRDEKFNLFWWVAQSKQMGPQKFFWFVVVFFLFFKVRFFVVLNRNLTSNMFLPRFFLRM